MHDAGETLAAKTALRASFQAARKARSAGDLEAARAAIRRHALAECTSSRWTCVAAYVPLRTEPGSTGLLAGLADAGVRVLVPVTLPDRDLDWVQWHSPESLGARLGVLALTEASAVLVPALAVARDGTRLGRGGGSYDRALPRCAPTAPVVALLFDGELVESLPRAPWDRSVTDVVLPSGRVHL